MSSTICNGFIDILTTNLHLKNKIKQKRTGLSDYSEITSRRRKHKMSVN